MSDFTEKKDEEEKVVAVVAGDDDEDDDEADGPAVQEESTATFAPVVHLEEVDVKTHEEDEEAIYKQRAKLFTFGESLLNKGTGTKSWNERGIGEMKMLKHKETSHIRVLMRQEKTMKVIANHFLDPRITMTPNAGASDKSWVWVAFDFSDGELIETTFAIRFGTSELATEFKAAFSAAQKEMSALLSGADGTHGQSEANAAADALAALAVDKEHSHTSPTKTEAHGHSEHVDHVKAEHVAVKSEHHDEHKKAEHHADEHHTSKVEHHEELHAKTEHH